MIFRTRFGLVAGVWAALATGGLIVVPLAFLDRLPSPVASHWGPSGAPDDSAPFWVSTMIFLLIWLAVVGFAVGFVVRGSGFRRRASRAWLGAALAWGGVFALGMTALTVWANLDVADWRSARPLGWQVLIMIGLSLLAGWMGWLLARNGPDEKPGGEDRRLPSLRLRSGERVVWVSSAANPAVVGLAVAFLLVAAFLGAAVVFGLPGWFWSVVAASALIGLVVLALSSIRVHVSDQGIRMAFGPLRLPLRRVSVDKIDSAWSEQRRPSQVGGWGYRGLPGSATIMIRGGECLIIRFASGGELGISVDDAQHGAALLNALVAERSSC